MKLADKFLSKFGLQKTPPQSSRKQYKLFRVQARSYAAGEMNRLTENWNPPTLTGDADILPYLVKIRARSREMAHSNPYGRRYLNSLQNNVLGHEGVSFQSAAENVTARKKIEASFYEWGKKEFCTVTGRDTWNDVQRIVLRAAATDGSILIRMLRGKQINKFGFTLKLYEADHIDHNWNSRLTNGNIVRGGVESNKDGKILAFHVLTQHPGDVYFPFQGSHYRERIDASEFIYYYVKDRATQTIGVPWMTAVMDWLQHLNEYQRNEVMAAEKAAKSGGWFQNDKGETFKGTPDDATQGTETTEDSGAVLVDFDPQSFGELPEGWKFIPYPTDHPTAQYGAFVATTLYGISAGLNTDYSTITGDLSEANYSSMRSGKLETQEVWKGIQQHFIDNFCIEVFANWLEMALMMPSSSIGEPRPLDLPADGFEEFNQPHFRGRRWSWVDPSKDIDAAIKAIEYGIGCRGDYTADNGVGDLEELFDKLRKEKAAAKGLEFRAPNWKPEPAAPEDKPEAPASKSRNGFHLADLTSK